MTNKTDIKQQVQAIATKYSIIQYLLIQESDAEKNIAFFRQLHADFNEVVQKCKQMLQGKDYSFLPEIGYAGLLFDFTLFEKVIVRFEECIKHIDKNGHSEEIDKEVDDIIHHVAEGLNIARQELLERPREYSAFLLIGAGMLRMNEEAYQEWQLNGCIDYKRPHSVTPTMETIEKSFEDGFRAFEENSYRFFTLLTNLFLKELSKHKGNNNALRGVQDKWQWFLDNAVGYKSFLAQHFVTGFPPARDENSQGNSVNVSYAPPLKELAVVFNGVNNFTPHLYSLVLEIIEKSNKAEKEQLSLKEHISMCYFEQERLIKGLKRIDIQLSKDKSFDEALKEILKQTTSEIALSIVANQQGEFKVGKQMMCVEENDSLQDRQTTIGRHNAHHFLVNVYEKDALLGIKQQVDAVWQANCPHVLAHPFGGLSSEKSVVKQVTPHMQKALFVLFTPELRKDFSVNPDNAGRFLLNGKRFKKVSDCADMVKQIVSAKQKGVSFAILNSKSHDDTRRPHINMDGFSPFCFNTAELYSPNITSQGMVKELTKAGLANGHLDALEKLTHLMWKTDANIHIKIPRAIIDKLITSAVVEAKNGLSEKAKDTLSIITLLFGRYNSKECPEYLKQFKDVIKALNPQNLLDANNTSPLIRVLEAINGVKDINPISAPIFVKKDDRYRLIAHAKREVGAFKRKEETQEAIMSRLYKYVPRTIFSYKNVLQSIRELNGNVLDFFNNIIPETFWDGEENINALLSGKDNKGNNILHHLLQNPWLFLTTDEMTLEVGLNNDNGEQEEKVINAKVSSIAKDFFDYANSVTANPNIEKQETSCITRLVSAIPKEELVRLANEQNNAGRTPLEELCYFAEFAKDKAYCSFSLSKDYLYLLKNVMQINGLETSSMVRALKKAEGFWMEEPNQKIDTKNLVAQECQEELWKVIKYLGFSHVATSRNSFDAVVKQGN